MDSSSSRSIVSEITCVTESLKSIFKVILILFIIFKKLSFFRLVFKKSGICISCALSALLISVAWSDHAHHQYCHQHIALEHGAKGSSCYSSPTQTVSSKTVYLVLHRLFPLRWVSLRRGLKQQLPPTRGTILSSDCSWTSSWRTSPGASFFRHAEKMKTTCRH